MPVRDLPTFDDVVHAYERIRGHVEKTPLLHVPSLDERAGVELYLKAENLQRIGAFKARGAMNAVLSLSDDERSRGLVTFSSGNHGQAVALAGRQTGANVHVVMPEDAPRVKVDAVRALGAAVTFAGRTTDDRQKVATKIVEDTGATMIPPFDDARVIAGQGTATLELLQQAKERGVELDAVLVPVGGGGLLAGACLAASGSTPSPRVIAVEPEAADAFAKSFAAKERVAVTPKATLADGLRPVRVGERNFAIAGELVSDTIVVDEPAIERAVVALALEAKLVVEPSGACSVAAALSRLLPSGIRRVAAILSGGNVEPVLLARLLGATSA